MSTLLSKYPKLQDEISIIATSVFVCDEPDKTTLEQYNIIMSEDGDEFAFNAVAVWEPFDNWDIDQLRDQISALESQILELFERTL